MDESEWAGRAVPMDVAKSSATRGRAQGKKESIWPSAAEPNTEMRDQKSSSLALAVWVRLPISIFKVFYVLQHLGGGLGEGGKLLLEAGEAAEEFDDAQQPHDSQHRGSSCAFTGIVVAAGHLGPEVTSHRLEHSLKTLTTPSIAACCSQPFKIHTIMLITSIFFDINPFAGTFFVISIVRVRHV
jgi:hypothetical protein